MMGSTSSQAMEPETGMVSRTLAGELVAERDAAVAAATEAARHLTAAIAAYTRAEAHADKATLGASCGFGYQHRSTEAHKLLTGRLQAPFVREGRGAPKAEDPLAAAVEAFRRATDADCWGKFLSLAGLRDLMDVQTLKEFEASLAGDVPPFTVENMESTARALAQDAHTIWRRGLANVFGALDPRFKSHDGFKVGTRIILTNVFDARWGHWNHYSHTRETLADVERAFAKLQEVADLRAADIAGALPGRAPTQRKHADDPTATPEVRLRVAAEVAFGAGARVQLHPSRPWDGDGEPDLTGALYSIDLAATCQIVMGPGPKRVFLKALANARPVGIIEAIERARTEAGSGFSAPRAFTAESRHVHAKVFQNGNVHLHLRSLHLVELLNAELAIYYGAILGDAIKRGATPKRHDPHAKPAGRANGAAARATGNAATTSTNALVPTGPDSATPTERALSHGPQAHLPWDAQFYPTPGAAAAKLVNDVERLRYPGAKRLRVLEPSAGTGHLVRAILDASPHAHVDAFEVHPDRASQIARTAPGVNAVRVGNFLATSPVAIYDVVAMNPPFGGTHYMDHVQHAWAFLAPGGTLTAILPASARHNESPAHVRFREWADTNSTGRYHRKATWRDLPAGSFTASGTNVETTILTMEKAP